MEAVDPGWVTVRVVEAFLPFVVITISAERSSSEGFSVQVMINSERGISINTPDLNKTIDTAEIPQFQEPSLAYATVFNASVIDLELLIFYSIISLFLSLVAFVRYDVR